MIEKKIHYVWFGKGQKSELILKCIESWMIYLPDYEIIEWNEEKFDINSNMYVKEAYENKKWAFVSDYVRLYVLYNFGGVYLDTDMEILKPIDKFLAHRAFSSFESSEYIPTGLMGAEKKHPWINELLQYYDNKAFVMNNGQFDLTPNVVSITQLTKKKYGLILNNEYQKLSDGLHIYPKEFFCPTDYGDNLRQKKKKITDNSYSIHHFNGSWLTPVGKLKVKIRNIIGIKYTGKIKKIIKRGI